MTKSILKSEDSVGSSNSSKRKLTFSHVEMRKYPFILGDNPCVHEGAPLAIDWNHFDEESQDFEMFEYMRKTERRHRKRLILSVRRRAKILYAAGYDISDIAHATMDVMMIKENRKKSALDGGRNKFLKNLNVADLISGAAEATGKTFKLNKALPTLTDIASDTLKGTGKVITGTGNVILGTGRGLVNGATTVATETTRVGKRASDLVIGTSKNIVIGTSKTGIGLVKGGISRSTSLFVKSGKRVSRLLSLQVPNKVVEEQARKRSIVGEDEKDSDVAKDIAAMMAAMDEDVLQDIIADLSGELEGEDSDEEITIGSDEEDDLPEGINDETVVVIA